jgi:hypothetical protein
LASCLLKRCSFSFLYDDLDQAINAQAAPPRNLGTSAGDESMTLPIYRLILIAAAILLHPNSLLASEFVVDAQMQARDLLSGTVGGQAKTVDRSRPKSGDGDRASNVDPQDQAVQLILGERNFGKSDGRPMALEPNPRTNSDPQESARRMILGGHEIHRLL